MNKILRVAAPRSPSPIRPEQLYSDAMYTTRAPVQAVAEYRLSVSAVPGLWTDEEER